jgi:hypothetical protein
LLLANYADFKHTVRRRDEITGQYMQTPVERASAPLRGDKQTEQLLPLVPVCFGLIILTHAGLTLRHASSGGYKAI